MHLVHSPLIGFSSAPRVCNDDPSYFIAYPSLADTDGSGIGEPVSASRGAIGESLERTFFYNLTSGSRKGRVADLNPDMQPSLRECFAQNQKKGMQDLETHQFHLSQAWNLVTGQKVWIPTVFISLAGKELDSDRRFMPFVDSTGCVAHNDVERAFRGAFLEFVERQSLIFSWYHQTSNGCIEVHEEDLGVYPRRIHENLKTAGTVKVFDISCFSNATVALALFSSPRGPVHYSAGMAAGLDVRTAMEKSLIELWQSYVFNLENSDKIESQKGSQKLYQREFLEMNVPETASKFSFFEGTDGVTCTDYVTHSFARLQSEVAEVSRNLFFFLEVRMLAGESIIYGKVFSPDFFMHKNICAANNFDNEFARKRFQVASRRSEVPIPFP